MRSNLKIVGVLTVAALLLGLAVVAAVPALQAETRDFKPRAAVGDETEAQRLDWFYSQIKQDISLTNAEAAEFETLKARFEDDRNPGNGLDNQGGPDAFDYFFMDNVAPDTATYSWIELRGDPLATWLPGSAFTSPDDGYSRQKVPIGFAFPFYGTPYDCVRVCANGFLNFTTTTASLSNVCLPASAVNAPIIAMFWDDLHLLRGGRTDTVVVGYRNFGNYFVLEFDQVGFYSSSCPNNPMSFQAILFNNGNIKLQYSSIPIPASCINSQSIGIQAAGTAGSAALNYVCNTTGIPPADGRAIWFFRPSGIPRPCTNLAGSVAGGNVTLTWTDPTLDTQGNPLTLDNVQVWLGAAGSGTLLATVAAGAQTYTHVNAPVGNLTYTVRPYRNPYYGAAVSVPVVVGTPSYSNNFDTNDGLWAPTPATGGWGWGAPWGITGLVPRSNPNVWGTALTSNYGNNNCWQLDFDQGYAVTSPAATIEFWYWYSTELTNDGCNFKASLDNGATWTVLTPSVGAYTIAAIGATNTCMAGQPAWSGNTAQTWRNCVIPVGQFLGQAPIFRFEFGSNATTNAYAGFYIDDMTMWGLQPQSGIPRPCTNLAGSVVANNVVLTWTDPTLDTQGNPVAIDSVQVWFGRVGSGTLLSAVAAGAQTYTHVGPPAGVHTYSVRPYRAPFYGNPTSIELIVGTPTYLEDFETTGGMWSPTPPTGAWEWGAPTGPGGPAPRSGANVWGTRLAANYDNNACWDLDLNLGLVVQSPTATVEFWAWYSTETSFDGCHFKVSTDGGTTWELVTPQGGYPRPSVSSNPCIGASVPVWAGNSGGWLNIVMPIGQYQGQTPIFRFTFGTDPSVNSYPGFFFDDMIMWGLAAPEVANVSGTVTLDGIGGTLTNVTVRSNGLGSPMTNPAANGAYTLTGVQVGDRILTASLAGYHSHVITATVPSGGLPGQNFVLRRTNPPAPTGLSGSVNNGTGVVTLDWADSPDQQVDLYRIYRKLRTEQNWTLRRAVIGRTNSQGTDTLTVGGIYQYRVTAVDSNVIAPAVESDPSNVVEFAYGAIPPHSLTADSAYDDRIRLTWLAPITPPLAELAYDHGINSVQGIGFRETAEPQPMGWLVTKFRLQEAADIARISSYFTAAATPGSAYEAGLFAMADDGRPLFEPVAIVRTAVPAADAWHHVELDPPIAVAAGVFFIGTRQLENGAVPLCVGGDETAAFQTNTFYSCGSSEAGWVAFETHGLRVVPMQRCAILTSPAPASEIEVGQLRRSSTPAIGKHVPFAGKAAGFKPGTDFSRRLENGKSVVDLIPADLPTARAGLTMADLWPLPPPVYTVERPARLEPVYTEDRGRRSTLDDVVRYLIYRNGTRIDSVAVGVLQYVNIVGSANENVLYSYYVTARYDNGEESVASNTVTARCGMPPGAPTAMSLTPVGSTQMRIQWTNPTVNADGTPCTDLAGVRVYRDGALLTTLGPGITEYADVPPVPTTRYTWAVRAIDEVPREGPAVSQSGAVQSAWRVVEYDWVDISQNGTDTGITGDDANGGPFDLGFAFPFYGTDYNSIRVCTNGWLSFTSTVTIYSNVQIPNVAQPNCALYPFWDDLTVVAGQGWIKYFADVANNRFIVTYHLRRLGGSVVFDFQVILTAGGGIRYQYQTLDLVNSATIGVENCDGTVAEQLNYNGAGDFIPTAGSAVEFWGGPTSSIMGTVRAFGTNLPIADVRVWAVGMPDTVITDVTGAYRLGIAPGTYSVTFDHPHFCDSTYANVTVEAGQDVVRNATLRAPQAQFSVTSITLTTFIGQNTESTFTLSNSGGHCPLDFAITDTSTWLSATPASGTVNPGQAVTITVTADVTGMGVGDYTSNLVAQFNAVGTPRTIRVDLLLSTAADDVNAPLPTEFALHPNFPNPFNASTSLRFDVPAESRVVIVLYNMTGQEVARPVESVYAPGRYRIAFDAGNLPSGMYLMRMTAGGTVQSGKLLLLK